MVCRCFAAPFLGFALDRANLICELIPDRSELLARSNRSCGTCMQVPHRLTQGQDLDPLLDQ